MRPGDPASNGTTSRPQEVHFPRVAEARRDYREARLEGSLSLQGGCVRLVSGSEHYVVIWPATAEIDRAAEGGARVVDPRTGSAVQVGDRVELIGGTVDRAQVGSLTEQVPESCTGPLWLAGSFRKLR